VKILNSQQERDLKHACGKLRSLAINDR